MDTKVFPTVKDLHIGDIIYHQTDTDIFPMAVLEIDEPMKNHIRINRQYKFYISSSHSQPELGNRDKGTAFTSFEEAQEALIKHIKFKISFNIREFNFLSELIVTIQNQKPYVKTS